MTVNLYITSMNLYAHQINLKFTVCSFTSKEVLRNWSQIRKSFMVDFSKEAFTSKKIDQIISFDLVPKLRSNITALNLNCSECFLEDRSWYYFAITFKNMTFCETPATDACAKSLSHSYFFITKMRLLFTFQTIYFGTGLSSRFFPSNVTFRQDLYNQGQHCPVWPDLVKFCHFGQFLTVYFFFVKIVNLLWQICYITSLIFIVANGQILKHNLTIWVTLILSNFSNITEWSMKYSKWFSSFMSFDLSSVRTLLHFLWKNVFCRWDWIGGLRWKLPF